MIAFKFEDSEIQETWVTFKNYLKEKFKASRIGKLPESGYDLERIINDLREELKPAIRMLSKAEYFSDVAYAESLLRLKVENPKMPMDMLKALAEGEIAEITENFAMARAIWSALEKDLMATESLLKKLP